MTTKDAFDQWWEWAEKPLDSSLTIDGDIHYPMMELSPKDRRDRQGQRSGPSNRTELGTLKVNRATAEHTSAWNHYGAGTLEKVGCARRPSIDRSGAAPARPLFAGSVCFATGVFRCGC